MSDILNKLIETAAEKGMKTAESVANFAYEQSPLLCEEVIRWGWISEITAPLIGLIFIITSLIFHVKFNKSKCYYDWDLFPVIIITILFGIMGFLMFSLEIIDVLYPLVAPRLYLIEKFSQLIK